MGHIPEKVYDALGFPKYEVSGGVYDPNYGIEREWMKISKASTHWFKKQLRLATQKKI